MNEWKFLGVQNNYGKIIPITICYMAIKHIW